MLEFRFTPISDFGVKNKNNKVEKSGEKMKRKHLIKTFTFICIFSIIGCSAAVKKGYQGPKLPDDKIAKVLIPSNIELISIDGESYSAYRLSLKAFYYVDILPGKHSIKILTVPSEFGQGNVSGPTSIINFIAAAGDTSEPKFVTYNIRRTKFGWLYETNAWIHNKTKYNKALEYSNNRQFEKAIALCNEALKESYCPDTHYLRGYIYFQIGEYNKTISDYSEAIKITSDPCQGHLYRGIAYFKAGKFDQALSDFNTAMKIPTPLWFRSKGYYPSDDFRYRILMYRANLYLTLGEKEKLNSDLMELNKIKGVTDSPLVYAVRLNQPEMVKHLIDKGDNINAKDSEGWTPLMIAVKNNQPEIARILIDEGSEVNYKGPDGSTALINAIETKDIKTINRLIKANANVNLKSEKGESPLQKATLIGSQEIISILKEAGAN